MLLLASASKLTLSATALASACDTLTIKDTVSVGIALCSAVQLL